MANVTVVDLILGSNRHCLRNLADRDTGLMEDRYWRVLHPEEAADETHW